MILLIVAAAGLAFAAPAFGAYWFFQGYIGPDGAVFCQCTPAAPIYQRASWAPCSHRMNIVVINRNGYGWSETFLYPPDCDREQMDQFPELHVNWGCHNPAGMAQVYLNCRAGTNP